MIHLVLPDLILVPIFILLLFSFFSIILLYLSLQIVFQRLSFITNFSQFFFILSSHSHLKSFILLSLLLLPLFTFIYLRFHGFIFIYSLKFLLLFHKVLIIFSIDMVFLRLKLISMC